MERLTPLSKVLIAVIVASSAALGAHTYRDPQKLFVTATGERPTAASAISSAISSAKPAAAFAASSSVPRAPARRVRVALSQWPGHMALLVGAGGLETKPGSIAAKLGLDFEIVFIEDAPSKNKALQTGEVDFVWQTVDELPISLPSYRAAGVDVRAFLQLDWSRGGDACVASKAVKKVEDILGRKSAMLMFSPDHTVFEFMISNSRLTPEQVVRVRKDTSFSPDDFTFGRTLFAEGKVEVACLWEPDVTLALASRPGAHRLFSTADASELVADVLLATKATLDARPEVAEKLAKVWFAAVAVAESDRRKAAQVISTQASRFRDELGLEKTLAALDWAKWTELSDNVRFFGLDGTSPAFDRVYNQADGIWINYPEAQITERFAPVVLRDDRIVERIWEAAGRPAVASSEPYEAGVANTGSPIFTKAISVNFASGSVELAPDAIAVINREILPQLEIARGMYARIEGNTDNVGDRRQNQILSERRAQAIADYLVARGVARERLVARGNGSSNPVATNDSSQGRRLNRRTDVLFIPKSRS